MRSKQPHTDRELGILSTEDAGAYIDSGQILWGRGKWEMYETKKKKSQNQLCSDKGVKGLKGLGMLR